MNEFSAGALGMHLRALIVDDSRVLRNMAIQGLHRTKLAEFEFVEAESADEALATLNTDEIDICFVNGMLKSMPIVEFVRQARSLCNYENVAIVLIAADTPLSRIEKVLVDADADTYICKPFTVEDLEYKLYMPIENIKARHAYAGGGI